MIYVESKKKDTNELIYKTEVELWIQKTNLWLPEHKEGGINWEIGIDKIICIYIHMLVYIEQITKKNLPCSTGNST